jgi:hypothetical protein
MAAMAVALWIGGVGAPRAAAVAGGQDPVSSPCEIATTERVVAVGDVHGAFEKFVTILREAQLIDGRRRWTGGRAILVQTGDILDRGPDSRKVLDLIRKLTDEAARAGGQVHALLGNHEAMRVIGYYRDVSAGEFDAFRSPDSADLRRRYLDLLLADAAKRAKDAGVEFDDAALRTRFLDETPLGWLEMQRAFGPNSDYGRWLRARDTMVRINGIVFTHGGPSAAVARLGCAAINAKVRAELGTVTLADPALLQSLIMGPDGPLWYRGLADGAPDVGQADVEAILAALGARAIVVGHTVSTGLRITSRFGGRVVQIDTGMLDGEFYPGGAPSALEIHGGTWTAIYDGARVPLVPSVPQG